MSRTLDVYIARKAFKLQGLLGIKRRRLSLKCGATLSVRTNDQLAQLLAVEEWFEPSVRKAIETLLEPGKTIMDIGANIGYYTLLASKAVGPKGKVIAVEPQVAMFNELQENVTLNEATNVSLVNVALGEKDQSASFFIPTVGSESLGSMRPNGRFHHQSEVITRVTTLDQVIRDCGVGEIDLIKMDVEGAELSVLKGAPRMLLSPSRPNIIFEANEVNTKPFGYTVFELLSFVASYGYTLTQLDHEDWLATRSNNPT